MKPLIWILFKAAMNYPLQRRRDKGHDLRNSRRIVVQNSGHRLRRRRLLERASACQHLVECLLLIIRQPDTGRLRKFPSETQPKCWDDSGRPRPVLPARSAVVARDRVREARATL